MDVEELRGLFLFEGLDDDQLGELLAAGEEISFDEGDGALPGGRAGRLLVGAARRARSTSCAGPAAASRS